MYVFASFRNSVENKHAVSKRVRIYIARTYMYIYIHTFGDVITIYIAIVKACNKSHIHKTAKYPGANTAPLGIHQQRVLF